MNYITGTDQIRFDGEVIRYAGFESESIKYQLSAEEETLLDFLDEIEEDDIFFDIGAHIGIYSIIASRKSKEIHSFEPHGGNYVRLNENIQKNSIDTIFTHNVALGNETKSARGMSGGRYLKSQIQRIRQMQEFGLKTGMNTENEWISPYQVS